MTVPPRLQKACDVLREGFGRAWEKSSAKARLFVPLLRELQSTPRLREQFLAGCGAFSAKLFRNETEQQPRQTGVL